MLWAFACQSEAIQENFNTPDFFFIREDPEDIVRRIDHVDIAAFSTYVWNGEISLRVAALLKRKFPECRIVFGGPHCPDDGRQTLEVYRFIDVIFHGESEISFRHYLEACVSSSDIGHIAGITYRAADGKPVCTGTGEKIADLSLLPSPFLTGILEPLFALPYVFHSVWETTRGCPYACTFCDWGASINSRVRQFPLSRLQEEIEWFGAHQIPWLYGADANFGILPRDVEIAEMLAAAKGRNSFPEKFRVNFAKNSTARVLSIAEILNRENLDKGITLSLQSMSPVTLANIHRKNLPIGSLRDFVLQYQRKNIATYTELILGLPGETYQSFSTGILNLLEAGVHNSLYVYNAIILPNAELNNPIERQKHNIQTKQIPLYPVRGKIDAGFLPEHQEIIVSTTNMSRFSWLKCHLFSWQIQTFHSLGLTQIIAVILREISGISYGRFYRELMRYARLTPGILSREFERSRNHFLAVLGGNGFEQTDTEFSLSYWSPEELSFLRILADRDEFYHEMSSFVHYLNERTKKGISSEMLDQLVEFQKSMLLTWEPFTTKAIQFNYPFHSVFQQCLRGEEPKFEHGDYKLTITRRSGAANKRDYAQLLVQSRRNASLFHLQVTESRGVEA